MVEVLETSGMSNSISIDLRKRILKAYVRGDTTRAAVASRFDVSEGMVKKLLSQRKHLGDISPQHHRSGRKPKIQANHRLEMRALLGKEPDLTLEEIRQRLELDCTIQAIHYVLADMGLTYKKDSPGKRTRARRRPNRA